MPHTRKHTFGPGSLESMVLTTWVEKKTEDNVKYKARFKGRYTVYCGNGWEHDVEIDETESGWLHEMGSIGRDIMNAHENGVALDFVGNLIDYALEDWFDPCDLEDEL